MPEQILVLELEPVQRHKIESEPELVPGRKIASESRPALEHRTVQELRPVP